LLNGSFNKVKKAKIGNSRHFCAHCLTRLYFYVRGTPLLIPPRGRKNLLFYEFFLSIVVKNLLLLEYFLPLWGRCREAAEGD